MNGRPPISRPIRNTRIASPGAIGRCFSGAPDTIRTCDLKEGYATLQMKPPGRCSSRRGHEKTGHWRWIATGSFSMALRPGRCRQRMESGGTASPSCGQRLNRASSAHLPSIRASWCPRQKWIPAPNDRCRLGLRARSSFSGCGLASGSMFAAANMAMILSPFFSRMPPTSISLLTKRFGELHRRDKAQKPLDG